MRAGAAIASSTTRCFSTCCAPWTRRLTELLGDRGYLRLYSAVSLLLLGWLIVAAGRAPYVPLWDQAPWQRWLALIAMALACLFAALAVGKPNPFSFGGGDPMRYDPARPGIVGLTRHPLLWVVALWATGHLLANGDLAHALLFGGFLAMALGGVALLDRRSRNRLGPRSHRLAARSPPGWQRGDAWRVLAAVLLFAALLLVHPLVIGVDPLAGP
jgi:uncharacterized membrane protein